jgi:CheY-like chemotaxis protein
MKKTILIIDDNKIITYAMERMFDSNSFDVVSMNDAKRGIEKCISLVPDILITDIEMPQVSGLDVIHSVRVRQEKTIIVAMSSRVSNREIALELGANHFLTKPVAAKDVLGLINA